MFTKAVNFMEKGDIYTSQKAYHKHNLDLSLNEEGDLEEEIEDEQNNLGLGGSFPILSLHHSFDAEETLQDIQEFNFNSKKKNKKISSRHRRKRERN